MNQGMIAFRAARAAVCDWLIPASLSCGPPL
jgi:hypothetical protein